MIYVALLRAVNVGGQWVGMAGLRAFLGDLGLANPRSLLQSGNLVFETAAARAAVLEERLEAEAEQRLGLKTAFFVRNRAEWAGIIAANPFTTEAQRDPARLIVMVLKHAPSPEHVEALQASMTGPERLSAVGRAVYVVYPAGMGGSRLTGAVIERRLGTSGTARNWNTMVKVQSLITAATRPASGPERRLRGRRASTVPTRSR